MRFSRSKRWRGRRLRLRTQVLLLQSAVVALALTAAFGAFAYVNDRHVEREYQLRALGVARTVAANPVVRAQAAHYSVSGDGHRRARAEKEVDALAEGPVQALAQAARARTGSLFVVVTDDRGVRLAHPQKSQLGRMVSTDPSRALAGHEVLDHDHAHLGEEIVAKVPVYAPHSHRVVGEANAGVAASHVHDQVVRVLLVGLACLAVALLVGVMASAALARRWRRLTLGLEPEELVGLVQEQEAVLHGIGDGVLALDARERVTVVNDEARRLLAVDGPVGAPVSEWGLNPRVLAVARAARPDGGGGEPVVTTAGERVLVVSARRVRRADRDLGTLVTVKDRTDVESLTRQLDAVQAMSTALRAQRHEFSNRLHVVAGLVHGGHLTQAARYLEELLGTGSTSVSLPGLDAVDDAYLRTFLRAKAAQARENGVELTLGEGTWVDSPVTEPVDVTTVLGNLLDNAVHAAGEGGRTSRQVEVELMTHGTTLVITVADSGDGVPLAHAEDIFEEGVSSKEDTSTPGGRGVGLVLVRQIARSRGGEVELVTPGGPGNDEDPGGAVFVARLPGVLKEAR
ncbi:ATP-binding protein [Streptomyces sp. NBC_00006]|uniref:sensor histidine kinase n=1 Tax=Streptomyces sp. NBC_00006 TaxID=2975619 RepID=UPI002252A632|nr:ATP-binding protein [Streptomyces sp. NBC_00006]MCX5537616.1 ATP-binding protein [Streptomyces sp. NBC_00006]